MKNNYKRRILDIFIKHTCRNNTNTSREKCCKFQKILFSPFGL